MLLSLHLAIIYFATQLDSNGKPVLDKSGNAKTHDVNGIISDAKAFDSSQKIGDENMGMGLHCDNTLKNGETCRAADAADVADRALQMLYKKPRKMDLILAIRHILKKMAWIVISRMPSMFLITESRLEQSPEASLLLLLI